MTLQWPGFLGTGRLHSNGLALGAHHRNGAGKPRPGKSWHGWVACSRTICHGRLHRANFLGLEVRFGGLLNRIKIFNKLNLPCLPKFGSHGKTIAKPRKTTASHLFWPSWALPSRALARLPWALPSSWIDFWFQAGFAAKSAEGLCIPTGMNLIFWGNRYYYAILQAANQESWLWNSLGISNIAMRSQHLFFPNGKPAGNPSAVVRQRWTSLKLGLWMTWVEPWPLGQRLWNQQRCSVDLCCEGGHVQLAINNLWCGINGDNNWWLGDYSLFWCTGFQWWEYQTGTTSKDDTLCLGRVISGVYAKVDACAFDLHQVSGWWTPFWRNCAVQPTSRLCCHKLLLWHHLRLVWWRCALPCWCHRCSHWRNNK